MTTQFKADFTGAFKKTQTALCLGKAHKYQATSWAAETVKELKRSAANMQKSPHKTSQMGRNVGMQISAGDDKTTVVLGTGVGGTQTVPYARIQDLGGKTKAHMIYAKPGGVLAFTRASGAQLAAEKNWRETFGGHRSSMIFLSHVHHPGSKIPASFWFKSVIDKREPILGERMKPEVVLRVAEIMASSSAGKLAKGG